MVKTPMVDEPTLRRMVAEKLSNVDMAARVGCKPQTICYYKHIYGIKTKPYKAKARTIEKPDGRPDGRAIRLSELAPKGKRLNNAGGIRIALLSRSDDASRPPRRGSAEFLFGSQRKAQVSVEPKAELVARVPESRVDLDLLRHAHVAEPVTMLLCRADQCAWIVREAAGVVPTMCCGAPVFSRKGRQFCAEHRSVARGRGTASEQAAGRGVSA